MNFSISEPRSSRVTLRVAVFLATLWVILSIWIYVFEPMREENAEYLNLQVSYAPMAIAGLAAAVMSTLLVSCFQPTEQPFRVWLAFSLGWWLWAIGEAVSFVPRKMYWALPIEQWPDYTIADFFWLAGYLSFLLALFFQFRLIYGYRRKTGIWYYFVIVFLILLVSLGVNQWVLKVGLASGRSWLATYISSFFPVADLTIGVAALWLLALFQRGKWGRPWGGLIMIAFADGMDVFIWFGGEAILKRFSEDTHLLSVAFDFASVILYVVGYLFVAITCLMNYYLARYGLSLSRLPLDSPREVTMPDNEEPL